MPRLLICILTKYHATEPLGHKPGGTTNNWRLKEPIDSVALGALVKASSGTPLCLTPVLVHHLRTKVNLAIFLARLPHVV